MIKQILTHYKKTYIIKSFKEYTNNKLILCEKYNPHGNIIYRYRRNIEERQEWQKWIYDENNGDLRPITISTDSITFKTGVNDKVIQYGFDFNWGQNYKLII